MRITGSVLAHLFRVLVSDWRAGCLLKGFRQSSEPHVGLGDVGHNPLTFNISYRLPHGAGLFSTVLPIILVPNQLHHWLVHCGTLRGQESSNVPWIATVADQISTPAINA